MLSNKFPVACVIEIAANTGYLSPGSWMAMADEMIRSKAEPSIFSIKLAETRDLESLAKLLTNDRQKEIDYFGTDVYSSGTGFIWKQYKGGKLALHDAMKKCGEFADSGWSNVECEAIYRVLSLYESKEISHDEAIFKMDSLLGDSIKAAEESISNLENWFAE